MARAYIVIWVRGERVGSVPLTDENLAEFNRQFHLLTLQTDETGTIHLEVIGLKHPKRSVRTAWGLSLSKGSASRFSYHGRAVLAAHPPKKNLLRKRLISRRFIGSDSGSRSGAERALLSMKTDLLVIIPCGSEKAKVRRKARHLYTSRMFQVNLRWAESVADLVLILSAKHGLIDLDDPIEPYDTFMGDVIGTDLEPPVREQARKRKIRARRIIGLGGKDYREVLALAFPSIEFPLVKVGGGNGYQAKVLDWNIGKLPEDWIIPKIGEKKKSGFSLFKD